MALNLKSAVRAFAFLLVATVAHPATIAGRVIDAETGATIPATITIRASDGTIVTDHPSFQAGFRSSGTFEKQVPAGETTIVVSRGFDYLAVQRRFTLAGDERRTETFELRRRSALRREDWYWNGHPPCFELGEPCYPPSGSPRLMPPLPECGAIITEGVPRVSEAD